MSIDDPGASMCRRAGWTEWLKLASTSPRCWRSSAPPSLGVHHRTGLGSARPPWSGGAPGGGWWNLDGPDTGALAAKERQQAVARGRDRGNGGGVF